MNPIITFENVSKIYKQPTEELALRDVNFTVSEGEFVCFIGPSGCGKSTILKIIAGIDKESSGQVIKPKDVSMVFQIGSLFPWFTVFENVALVLRSKGFSENEVLKESRKYIELMGLADFYSKFPRDLSGGQRQRVGIARALAVNPSVMLLDEPFSALDPKITDELHKDLLNIWKETKKTIVLVSHSIEEAAALGDRVFLMKDFTIQEVFPISLPRPRHERGEEFSKEVNKIRKEFFK